MNDNELIIKAVKARVRSDGTVVLYDFDGDCGYHTFEGENRWNEAQAFLKAHPEAVIHGDELYDQPIEALRREALNRLDSALSYQTRHVIEAGVSETVAFEALAVLSGKESPFLEMTFGEKPDTATCQELVNRYKAQNAELRRLKARHAELTEQANSADDKAVVASLGVQPL